MRVVISLLLLFGFGSTPPPCTAWTTLHTAAAVTAAGGPPFSTTPSGNTRRRMAASTTSTSNSSTALRGGGGGGEFSEESNSRAEPSTAGNTATESKKKVQCVDCAIIGAGPAGFATAIALSKASPNSSIAIFEKENFQPKGASLSINKTGWKSLKALDRKKVAPGHKKKDTNNPSGTAATTARPISSLVKQMKNTGARVVSFEFQPWRKEEGEEEESSSLGKTVMKYISKAMLKVLVLIRRQKAHLWHDIRMTLREHAKDVYDNNVGLYVHDYEEGVPPPPFVNPNCDLHSISTITSNDCNNNNNNNNDTTRSSSNNGMRFNLIFQKPSSSNNEEKVEIQAKYIFACDGGRSKVRSLLPSEPDILLDQNKSVWRGVAPNVMANGKAIIYKANNDGPDAGKLAIIFPAGKNTGTSWTVISDAEPGKSTSDEEARRRVLNVIQSMGNDDSGNAMNGDQCHIIKKAIDDSPIIIENKIMVRDYEKPWESSIDGLVYIGDALHPLRPAGKGIALALEDATVLNELVEESGLSVDTLRKFEKERFEPVKQVADLEQANAQELYSKSKEPSYRVD